MAIKPTKGAKGHADVFQFPAWFAVLISVVPFGPSPIAQDQFGDGLPIARGQGGQASAIAKPLGNQTIVLGSTFGAFIFAKIVVFAVDPDNGLARGLVVTIRRGSSWTGFPGAAFFP
jgi:hypothetical protein